MTRSQTILLMTLVLALFMFTALLAWQVAGLRAEIQGLLAAGQGALVDERRSADKMSKFVATLAEHDAALDKIKTALAELPVTLTAEAKRRFLPRPLIVPEEPLFKVAEAAGGIVTVTGDLEALSRWEERNKLYLDFVFQDSLVTDYDSALRRLVARTIIPHSVFFAMGLRSGDAILNVDGLTPESGDDLRFRIMDRSPFSVDIIRGEERLTLKVDFTAGDADLRRTALTRAEFNALLPLVQDAVTILPSLRSGGARVTRLNPDHPLALIGLEDDDAITAVDAVPVTSADFLKRLTASKESRLKLDVVRAEKTRPLTVEFAP